MGRRFVDKSDASPATFGLFQDSFLFKSLDVSMHCTLGINFHGVTNFNQGGAMAVLLDKSTNEIKNAFFQ